MIEEFTHLRKSKPVIISAALIWGLIAFHYTMIPGDYSHEVEQALEHNILEFAELFLFLLVAMTYINALQERNVFDFIRYKLVAKGFNFRQLFLLTGVITFFLSPIADNLTTALVMCSVLLACGKGNNKFLITDYKNTNKFSYDKDFIVDYHFKIQDYAKFLGDEIYLNLNLNKYLSYAKPEKDRENELEYDFKNQLEFTTVLEIPEGYVVDYIPQNEIVESDLLTASITYKQQENSIIYKHEITLNFIELTLEEQKEVIKLIDKMEKAYNEIIVLKKKA